MYKKAIEDDADFVYCNFKMIFNNHEELVVPYSYDGKKSVMLNNFLSATWQTVWNTIVKKDIYRDYEIYFPTGITFCEDFYVSCKLMYYSRKISYVDVSYYNYDFTNVNSALHNISQKQMNDEIYCCLNIIDFFINMGMYDKYSKHLCHRVLKGKQELVLSKDTYEEFLRIHPDSHKYIWSCPYLNTKLKIMMWCLSHNMRIIAQLFLFAREMKLQIKK